MYYLSRSKFVRCSYFLEVTAIEYNIDSSNPGTSRHPHMSNRIYDTLDSDKRVYFVIFIQKNRLSEPPVFVYSNAYFL